jgi:hypothetical protein
MGGIAPNIERQRARDHGMIGQCNSRLRQSARKLYQASLPLSHAPEQIPECHSASGAACHALHTVEARLCRWLLQSQDMTDVDLVPLTQDFLSHMLGVRRTTCRFPHTRCKPLA